MEGSSRKLKPATFHDWTITSDINNSLQWLPFLLLLTWGQQPFQQIHQPVDNLSSNLQIVLRSLTICLSLATTHYTPLYADFNQAETEQSVLRSDKYNTSKQIFFVYCPIFQGLFHDLMWEQVNPDKRMKSFYPEIISKKSSLLPLICLLHPTAIFCWGQSSVICLTGFISSQNILLEIYQAGYKK